MRVELDRYSLTIDGRRTIVRAGALHYFRLPARALWRDRLQKMRDAGLNAVDVYYPWNFHSEARGRYDWDELRDVDHLHDQIESLGLYLIARPGPYICAELDGGGLPGWVLADRSIVPRCRTREGFQWSRDFVDLALEWFGAIVPRFAARANLIAVQIENEYALPAPMAWLSSGFADLAIRTLGARRLARLAESKWLRALALGAPSGGEEEQSNAYMRELYRATRALGVRVPIFHNDLARQSGRQTDVDWVALDRYPITAFRRDWRDDPRAFDSFRGDEAALDELGRGDEPVFYPELQAGWYDGWGGSGYSHVRARLGADGIVGATVAALAERATAWSYYVFAGGTTLGYSASPDVYSSYDYGAPIDEHGATGERFLAVKALNEFVARHEADLARTDRDVTSPGAPAEFAVRLGAANRYVFQRDSKSRPWATQIRVESRASGETLELSPALAPSVAAPSAPPPLLPRLERWRFSCVSPQLAVDYDDSAWTALAPAAVACDSLDLDSLGLHYGFAWYRGRFRGALDRLVLDARHCWAAWLNGELLAAGDQLRNPLGVGADGARRKRVSLAGIDRDPNRENALVIAVESLGHNKGFADDARNPRGLVSLDTGSTRIHWRYRGGLVRGERGLVPRVDFAQIERSRRSEVVLPHGFAGAPEGVALYETSFRLESIDPKRTALALAFDPGRGKANLYLNGLLIGRYWPERGPQRRFALPWGVLDPDEENQLAVALWKRDSRAALGKLRLEVA